LWWRYSRRARELAQTSWPSMSAPDFGARCPGTIIGLGPPRPRYLGPWPYRHGDAADLIDGWRILALVPPPPPPRTPRASCGPDSEAGPSPTQVACPPSDGGWGPWSGRGWSP